MVQVNNISYKKIDLQQKSELTPNLIHKMYEIDGVFGKPIMEILGLKIDDRYQKKIEQAYHRIINEHMKKGNYTFYFMYDKNKLLGCAYGEFTKRKEFFLDSIFIDPKFKMEGHGTKLLARVIADLRVNHSINTITMIPRTGTKEINKNLTGNKHIKFKINGEPKEILRKFHSDFKYDLKTIAEKKENPYKEQLLVVRKTRLR